MASGGGASGRRSTGSAASPRAGSDRWRRCPFINDEFRRHHVLRSRREDTVVGVDIVLDSGCLHRLPRNMVGSYRRRLDDWPAPGGDDMLVHFAHRPRVGRTPKGPGHLRRVDAVVLFAPLELRD